MRKNKVKEKIQMIIKKLFKKKKKLYNHKGQRIDNKYIYSLYYKINEDEDAWQIMYKNQDEEKVVRAYLKARKKENANYNMGFVFKKKKMLNPNYINFKGKG